MRSAHQSHALATLHSPNNISDVHVCLTPHNCFSNINKTGGLPLCCYTSYCQLRAPKLYNSNAFWTFTFVMRFVSAHHSNALGTLAPPQVTHPTLTDHNVFATALLFLQHTTCVTPHVLHVVLPITSTQVAQLQCFLFAFAFAMLLLSEHHSHASVTLHLPK